jgi:hypothetical protein
MKDIGEIKPTGFKMNKLDIKELLKNNSNMIPQRLLDKNLNQLTLKDLQKGLSGEAKLEDEKISYNLFDLWLKNKRQDAPLDNLKTDSKLGIFSDRNYKHLQPLYQTASKNLLLAQIETMYYEVFLQDVKYMKKNEKQEKKELIQEIKKKEKKIGSTPMKIYDKAKEIMIGNNPFKTWRSTYRTKSYNESDPIEALNPYKHRANIY